jgi:transglutaminase-like putative cysteine protease
VIELGKTFKILSFSVVAVGFLTLIFTGALSVPVIVVTLLSLAVGWFYGDRLVRIARADTVAAVAILAIFALSVAGFFFLDRPFVATTTTFLVSVQAVRILFLTEIRHYLQSYLIALFSVLGAAVLTFSPIFLFFLILYLVLATAAMIVLTMVADTQKIQGGRGSVELRRSHLVGFVGGSVAFTLVSAAVIFLFFPRLSAGFLPSSISQPVRVPGFSNNVELGEVGDLKVTSEIIMRVVIDDDAAERLGPNVYWRGTAFDTFDGKYWEKSSTRKSAVKKVGDTFIVDDGPITRPIEQEYFLEANDGRVLFCAEHPMAVSGPFMNLFVDRYGTVEMSRPRADKVRYTVRSIPVTGDVASPVAGGGGLTLEEETAYLRLPDALDGRIVPLVRRIVGDETSPERKADLIRGWLLQNMSYDLNPKGMGTDPLAEFLFDQRRGYCEHFATAMAVMLRIAGVPSRVVTGFLGGDYNEMGSFFIVRSSDAHAWVEAYIDGAGWTIYEATPPAGLAVPSGRSSVRKFFDNLMMKWHIYVVNYEMEDQLKIVEGIRDARKRGGDRVSDVRSDVWRLLAGLKGRRWAVFVPVLIAAAAVLLFGAWYVVRGLVAGRRGSTAGSDRIVRIYLAAVRLLAKKGIDKGPAMTPREFSRKVARDLPAVSGDLDSLTEVYYEERFGGSKDASDADARARRHLDGIRETLRAGHDVTK